MWYANYVNVMGMVEECGKHNAGTNPTPVSFPNRHHWRKHRHGYGSRFLALLDAHLLVVLVWSFHFLGFPKIDKQSGIYKLYIMLKICCLMKICLLGTGHPLSSKNGKQNLQIMFMEILHGYPGMKWLQTDCVLRYCTSMSVYESMWGYVYNIYHFNIYSSICLCRYYD